MLIGCLYNIHTILFFLSIFIKYKKNLFKNKQMPALNAEQVKKRLQNIEKKKKTLNCDVIMKMQAKDYKTKDGRIEGVQNRLQCNELNLQKKRLEKKLAEMKPSLKPKSPPVKKTVA